MFYAMSGLVFGVVLVMAARQYRWDWLQLSLFLPAIYVGFAIFSTTPTQSVIEEMFFAMPILTLIGISHMQDWDPDKRLKAAFGVWLYHGGYDYVHHWLVVNDGVPVWYPPFCAVVDMVIALYLGWLWYQLKVKNNSQKARR
jgi:hypothetical protein